MIDQDDVQTAIVNSSTFGRHFPELLERLEALGPVQRFQFDPEVDGQTLVDELDAFPFIVASVTPHFPRTFFENNDELLLLARHGIGCDNVDLEAATDTGVIVTRIAGEPERDAVAELSLSLIMACLRDVVPGARASKALEWEERRHFVGRELSHMTVGVIGYGNIGSRVGEIISEGFGADVLAYDPNIADPVLEKAGVEPTHLHDLVRRADLISLNASHNPGNFEMIGEEEIGLMKDGVYIVNTARGELTDEDAIAKAVASGKIARLGVDVLQREPIRDDHPFLELDDVIVLPHVGSYTERSLRLMDEKNVEDIEKALDGTVPDEIANPDVLVRGTRAEVSA
jgi:phosphoglycerate dehydrogenase-like enzyme